jgi:Family of unknown function (DUF5675)
LNLILKRTDSNENGVFGQLTDSQGTFLLCTLEHAYDSGLGNGSYSAKIPLGTYQCTRGVHALKNGPDFITFMVNNVPGHQGILFHAGNFNKDSEGCILLGLQRNGDMITESRLAFHKFLDLQDGIDKFILTVL